MLLNFLGAPKILVGKNITMKSQPDYLVFIVLVLCDQRVWLTSVGLCDYANNKLGLSCAKLRDNLSCFD